MMHFRNGLLLIITLYQISIDFAVSRKELSTELCLWETFKPECSGNEVVFINSAKYGRMNAGKCLSHAEIEAFGAQSKEPRYFGCFNDVTDSVSSKCSVERQCEVKVKDFETLADMACFPGLKMYLEIRYSCLPLIEGFERCHVFASSEPKHLLVSSINLKTCGSLKIPLIIEASKGQKIKFTHISRSSDRGSLANTGNTDERHCMMEAGLIMEKNRSGSNVSICENGLLIRNSRQSFEKSFISKENLLSAVFNSQNENARLLLEIKAEGCLDIIPPEDTWLKRNNDDIVIGCYSSKQTWYLKCEDGHWTGTLGNCSNPDVSGKHSVFDEQVNDRDTNGKLNISPVHQTLVIIAICGFGVVVCTSIVCIGLVCLKRLNSKEAKNQSYYNVGQNYQIDRTIKCNNNNQTMMNAVRAPAGNPGFNESLIYGRDRAVYADGTVEDERYQILDKEEVAKENMPFA